jgi:putative serine protease PepD
LARGTVLIFLADFVDGNLSPFGVGSGTVISPDGLILTNAHVAKPSAGGFGDDPDALVVAIVESEDRPPVATYTAEVRAADGFLDLAVIQITAFLDGSRLDPSSLNLEFVELGDSDDIHLGDNINIFGFPVIGDETITFTKGSVSGFSDQDQVGARAWIKTDATISGGNSGGLGANDRAQIVGVPTRAGTGDAQFTDCRVLQDTNGDGQITDEDNCIPIGGFINSLRPINFALPLIRAAQTGVAYESPYSVPGVSTANNDTPGTGGESFALNGWSVDFDSDSCPIDPQSSFPSGILQITASFSYSGMTDGQLLEYYWLIDEEVVFNSSFNWDGGSSSACFSFWLENGGDAMPDGDYAVLIYTGDGLPLVGEAYTGVGSSASSSSASGVAVSGIIVDGDTGNPIDGAIVAVLNPGVDIQTWLDSGTDSDVFAFIEVGADGIFDFAVPFERGVEYPVVIGAEGYQLLDGFFLFEDSDPDVFELRLELFK